MTEVSVTGSAVLLEDGLQAGQLIHEEAAQRTPETKEYAAFVVDPDSGAITYGRVCTRAEKKRLGKMLYSTGEIHRMRKTTASGEPCTLFVRK